MRGACGAVEAALCSGGDFAVFGVAMLCSTPATFGGLVALATGASLASLSLYSGWRALFHGHAHAHHPHHDGECGHGHDHHGHGHSHGDGHDAVDDNGGLGHDHVHAHAHTSQQRHELEVRR